MKKIGLLIIIAGLLVACEPIENRKKNGGGITVDQLNATVELIEVGGVRTNRVVVQNNSPLLQQWSNGIFTSTAKVDTMLLFSTGEHKITFTGLNADGSSFTKDFTVNVESIYYPLPEEYTLLCGENGKTWVWAVGNKYREDGAIFGNGPGTATYPEWWAVGPDEMKSWGLLYDEMIFDLDGGCNFTLISKGADGTENKVTKDIFVLDLTSKTIQTANGTPFIREESDPVHTIVRLTENELTLTIPVDGGSNREVLMFKQKGYEYED